MDKLIVFSFTANRQESRLTTHLTELHFVKLIGTQNIYGVNDSGADFNRDDGWGTMEEISSLMMKSNNGFSFAIVMEYPTPNILELYESIANTWGKDKVRLYIRVSNTLEIHPFIYSYKTLDINADELLSNVDDYVNQLITPTIISRKNCFNEFSVELPNLFRVEVSNPDQVEAAREAVETINKLLKLNADFLYHEGSGNLTDDAGADKDAN